MSSQAKTTPASVSTSREMPRHAPSWLVLALVSTGQFMVIMDASIVNVALPSIRASLGFSAAGLAWVINCYLLTFGGFLLLGGRGADLFGGRRMLVTGFGVFSAASLACGFAPSPAVLVSARAVQGLGAAILAPSTLAVLTTQFTESRARAKALSIWTAVGGLGGVTGTIVGGVITVTLSWRWIFLVNAPVGIAAITVAMCALAAAGERTAGGLDVPGAVCVTAGMTALTFGIVQTGPYGWASARVLAPIAAGVALLAAFLLIEGSLTARPMLPLQLLRSGAVVGGFVPLVLIGATSLAGWYFSSLFFQNVLKYSPMRAGLALAPAAVALVLTAMCVPPVVSRTGPRTLILTGCLCQVIGFGWLSRATPVSAYVPGLLVPTVLLAIGIGLIFTPATVTVTSRVTRRDAGIVSGLANASGQAGGTVGLAALATVASVRTQSLLGGHASGKLTSAVAAGYNRVFVIAAVLAVITALSAFTLLRSDRTVQPVVR